MDQPSSSPTPNQAPVCTDDELAHHRDRRREKPQLSCTFCRRRKVKCDRQLPCNTCVSKGIALSCTYTLGPQRKGASGVGERIQELEALVRSLMQQQQQQTPQTSAVFQATSGESPLSVAASAGINSPLVSMDESTGQTVASNLVHEPLLNSNDGAASPAPSDHGSLRLHSHGANYVGSVHWAAVLDSISELRDHYEQEEEARKLASSDFVSRHNPGPRLLYEPVQATKADILASLPARPVVDRMVARYFNAQGVTPAVLHSGQFLREYESFWNDPASTPFAWIGLLFSIICLSTQYQQLTEQPADPNTLTRVQMYHERTVHCLVLGQFTRGGAHVLETMINHCANEALLCKDADIGLWLLVGMLVQLALSLGYHRDPRNFSNISPLAGEMRRRVWAAVVQIDLRLSSQMGLPRVIKPQQYDTADPRNLLDSDFDQETTELPPSRPETEVTPVLYGLAKNRIDSIGGLITDLVADTREHPYSEIMELDRKLQEAEDTLPPIFRSQPLSQSFMLPPQIILHRVWLQLAVQRLVIGLHRKYLAPSHSQARYEYSRNACVQAAIKILEFQQLVIEETQPDGQLYSVRWMMSSLLQSIYLLGMSVLCYYVQLVKTSSDVPLDRETGIKVHGLLRAWLRSSTVSRDARRAVEHLSLLLGLPSEEDIPLSEEVMNDLTIPQDIPMSLDQITWDTYQAFCTDFMSLDVPGSTTATSLPMSDSLMTNTTGLDDWINNQGSPSGAV